MIDKDYFLAKVRIMAKVTSKLQVTIPKALAKRFGIQPGDDIEWTAAGDAIRLAPARAPGARYSLGERLTLFDQATERQRERQAKQPRRSRPPARGWSREELYTRGGAG
jgi:AbrB family looped-hinge helix DNA binding protein